MLIPPLSILDDEISPLDLAEVAQPLSEGGEIRGIQYRGSVFQHADAPDFARLLRARCQRPGRRARRAASSSPAVSND
jgi:hypothetical protein